MGLLPAHSGAEAGFRMGGLKIFLALSLSLSPVSRAYSQSSQPSVAVNSPGATECPISLSLNYEERDAFIGFSVRLSHLNPHYGRVGFQTELNKIITAHWPVERVIEFTPMFMEKVLNLIDQQYLKNEIAGTIGLSSSHWQTFEHTMRKVTLSHYGTENKYGAFTKRTESLIESIKKVPAKEFKTRGLTPAQREILKARAITRIANMVVYLERMTIINKEIVKQNGQAAGQQLLLNAMGLTAAGVLVASMVYASPIVAGAGAFGASMSADIIVGAQLARLAQVLAGAGMGIAGAPTGLILTDTTFAVLEAQRQSANKHTVYACELGRQYEVWKRNGVSPYIHAALVGGSIGTLGGLLTLSKVGSRVLLLATTFGVGVAQAYTLGKINDEGMKALAEYRLAMKAQAAGDNAKARAHLIQSRVHAQVAGENVLETIIVGALSYSIAISFTSALIQGETAIRVVFANSADTIPFALGIAKESAGSIMNEAGQ